MRLLGKWIAFAIPMLFALCSSALAQFPPVYATLVPRVLRPDADTELYVIDTAKPRAETFLVLHGGWGAEHSYLMQPLRDLAAKGRVVFFDQRGSLRSPTKIESLSVDRHVEDVEYVRSSLGLGKVTLVAHSMGGFLAANYIRKYGRHVERAILIAPVPPLFGASFWPDSEAKVKSLAAPEAELVSVLRENGLARDQNPKGFSEDQDLLRRKLIFSASGNVIRWKDRWKSVFLGFYSTAVGGKMNEVMPGEVDLTADLKSWGGSLVVIAGEQDYVPIDYQERWIPKVPGARLVLLKNCGHLPWLDDPRGFGGALKRAIGGKTQRSGG